MTASLTIALEDVHLSIPVFAPNQLRLIRKPSFLSPVGGRLDERNGRIYIHALRGVSFELRQGQHLALIGQNGAGKTTLLKVIAGILPPSRGELHVSGTVGCLIDMAAGLTPDMTGYESIKFHHLLHGNDGEDWRGVAEEIADFTELGDYLNLPTRTYSAGMRARLMAAMATAWPRDILLIDEGIGAGDEAFQAKFAKRIDAFLARAGLLVFASHSQALLRKYCSLGIVLSHGEVRMMGGLDAALDFYSEVKATEGEGRRAQPPQVRSVSP